MTRLYYSKCHSSSSYYSLASAPPREEKKLASILVSIPSFFPLQNRKDARSAKAPEFFFIVGLNKSPIIHYFALKLCSIILL